MLEMTIAGRSVSTFATGAFSPGEEAAVVYIHSFAAGQAETIAKLCKQKYILVNLPWTDELTPWPAKKAFPKGKDFTGGGDRYGKELIDIMLPGIEEQIRQYYDVKIEERRRGLAGYSLAGLFALYTAYRTDCFPLTGSVSGSLWYDAFLQYVLAHTPMDLKPQIAETGTKRRFYFSLGDREERVREPRMRRVALCTEAIVTQLGQMYDVAYVRNPGGHFTEPEKRMASGIDALLR